MAWVPPDQHGVTLGCRRSHSVHHRRGAHTKNYSRIPLLDMVFGTFENPEYFEADTGFYPGASKRLLEMMVGVDVAADEKPAISASLRGNPATD